MRAQLAAARKPKRPAKVPAPTPKKRPASPAPKPKKRPAKVPAPTPKKTLRAQPAAARKPKNRPAKVPASTPKKRPAPPAPKPKKRPAKVPAPTPKKRPAPPAPKPKNRPAKVPAPTPKKRPAPPAPKPKKRPAKVPVSTPKKRPAALPSKQAAARKPKRSAKVPAPTPKKRPAPPAPKRLQAPSALVRKVDRLGTENIAKKLDVTPATLRRWLREGIPDKARAKVLAFFDLEKEERDDRKKDAKAFKELLDLAELEGKIKRSRTREGVRAGPKTSGYKWVQSWGARLTVASMSAMLDWFMSHLGDKRYPVWHAVAIAAAFGPGELPGSPPPKLYQFDHPRAGEFVYETIFQSSVKTSLKQAASEVEAEMRKSLDEQTIVYVHTLSLVNFRWRSDAERRAWETGKRRARENRRVRREKMSGSKAAQESRRRR